MKRLNINGFFWPANLFDVFQIKMFVQSFKKIGE